MAGPHGGPRPNSGRKPKAEKFAGPIAAAEEKLADRLPKLLESLIEQAMGWVVSEPDEEWIPSGLVTVRGPLRVTVLEKDEEGEGEGWKPPREEVWLDEKGKPVLVDLPVYPHLKPDVLVLVRRKTVRIGPDFRAAAYLVDRVMDKVGTERPAETETLDIRAALVDAHARVFARRAAGLGLPQAPATTGVADGAGPDG